MKFIDNIDVEKYNLFVKQNTNCNIFQSPEWTEVKNTWGSKRLALIDDSNNIVATTQILTRNGLWYVPRGPILDYSNSELLNTFLAELKVYAKKNNAKLLKIDIPEPVKTSKLVDFKETSHVESKETILEVFANQKFKHTGFNLAMNSTIQPRFEVVTDLSADFLSQLPKDTRRLIRDAEKKFVKVKQINVKQIDDFMYALECTEKRKGISLRNKDYFLNLFNLYKENCLVFVSYIDLKNALLECENRENTLITEIENLGDKSPKKKRQLEEQVVSVQKLTSLFSGLLADNDLDGEQVISASFTIVYGKSAEMIYAGMDERFAKLPAQYKVYADTMEKAASMGVEHFSTGGIEGTLDDSLLLFKSKFNPNIVEHYGEFDYAISKIYKLMYDYGLPLRRKLLKLIRR